MILKLITKGYRHCKYELTGQLDPLGTIYNFDQITPLYSNTGEECALCSDVRFTSDQLPLKGINTICRYLACKNKQEMMAIFRETQAAVPAMVYDSNHNLTPEFYRSIASNIEIFTHSKMLINIGVIRFALDSRLFYSEVLKEAPVDFFDESGWKSFFRHAVRDYLSGRVLCFPMRDNKYPIVYVERGSRYYFEPELMKGVDRLHFLYNYYRITKLDNDAGKRLRKIVGKEIIMNSE